MQRSFTFDTRVMQKMVSISSKNAEYCIIFLSNLCNILHDSKKPLHYNVGIFGLVTNRELILTMLQFFVEQKEKAVEEEIEVDPDVAAMMGFGGFGSSKK